MKKTTIFGVTLSMVCILLLLGLGFFLMTSSKEMNASYETAEQSQIHSEAQTDKIIEEFSVSAGEADPSALQDSQTAKALAAAQGAGRELPEHHLIFVGDSRTVGMGEAETDLGDVCTYIGAVGEGYYWLEEKGLEQMEAAMEQFPDSPVVLNLGVNDPDALPQYLELYQTFGDRYPNHKIYFMSVNPVTEKCESRTNEEIAAFNAKIKETFPDQYLDCNTYMKIREFESADGIHYSKDTYRMIHDYVVRQIFQ